MDLAVIDGSLHLDGIGAVVPELVVQGAPVDRGVHAEGNVIHDEHVGRPLRGLEVRLENGIVNAGSHLADAAADLGSGHAAAGIDQRFPVALFLGPLTYHPVEGELLSGENDRAVQGRAGQSQVVGTVIGGSVIRMGLSQHVLEQAFAQGLRVGLGLQHAEGHLYVLAGLRSFQRGLKGLAVKSETVASVLYLSGRGVQLRFHRILAVTAPQRVNIHRGGQDELIGNAGLHDLLRMLRDQGKGIGVRYSLIDRFGVQLPAVQAGVDGHDLIGDFFFPFFGLGLVPDGFLYRGVLQLYGGVRDVRTVFGDEFFDLRPQRLFIENQVITGVQQVAVRAVAFPAYAGVQVGSQLDQIQMNVADHVRQRQDQRFLLGFAVLGVRLQRQDQVFPDHHIQLGKTPLQLRSRHSVKLHGSMRRGGAGILPAVLREDQDADHQDQHARDRGKHGPQSAQRRILSPRGRPVLIAM